MREEQLDEQPEKQLEEKQPLPLAQSLSFGAGTFLTIGLIDLLAHLGPTGLVVGGIAAYVAARHGPEVTSQVREALPALPSRQPESEERQQRGKRSFMDRALGAIRRASWRQQKPQRMTPLSSPRRRSR